MRVPITWFKDYISFSYSAEKLSEVLTMSGTAVEGVENVSGESVLELEITTNRPDCLSLIGIARELSALTGARVKVPALKKNILKKANHIGRFSVTIQDKKACPFYTARLIENVSISGAPIDAQKRLDWAGVRPISNAVDATNFVLFEMGQPLHAFDADKISGGITVRRAKKGEKFVGINGVEYSLEDKTLIIADDRGPVAIAGVIGGKNTEVSHSTKNILLESAYFDPLVVRQAARLYKVATDSSYRFERGVNPENVASASVRARDLILEWAKGEDKGGIAVGALPKSAAKATTVRTSRVKTILGVDVKPARIVSILKSLGIPASAGKDRVTVYPTAARRDVVQEADVIEEILRIEGFDKIPAVLPVTHHDNSFNDDAKFRKILKLKNYLAAAGLQEIETFSFLSAKTVADSGLSVEATMKVANPLSAEQEYVRPSLLPGMMGAIAFNVNRKQSALKFFEIGNCCIASKEKTVLAVSFYGNIEENWRRKSESSFYELKGLAENILALLGVKDFTLDKSRLRVVSSDVLKKWDIPNSVYYAELDLDDILAASSAKVSKVKPVAKFPSVKRDIAFIIDEKIPVGELSQAILAAGAPYLEDIKLFDQYIGKNIPKGKRSLAFSLAYQNPSGTFTDQEIQGLQERVGSELKSRFQAEFR